VNYGWQQGKFKNKRINHLGVLRSFTNHTRIFSMRLTRLPSLIRSDPDLSNLN
jgi:hypothetical protein